MAAPPLRDVYDCAVIGEGWAAALFAIAFAQAGLSTVLVAKELPCPVDAWLHPRLQQDGLHELPQLRNVRGIVVYDRAGEVGEVLRPNLLEPVHPCAALRPVTSGVSPDARRPIGSRNRAPMPATAFAGNARCVVQFGSRTASQCAVGGIYRQVTLEPGDEHFAQLFPTRLPGVVAWLAACGNGLSSLGVIRTADDDPNGSMDSAAELFEEALVACPALTRRLGQAQLVGDLHWRGVQSPIEEPSRMNDAIVLPAYDAEIDPLFAGGYELATRCAHELADLMIACRDVPGSVQQRIAQWHEAWQETEQGVRNLVHYYYSCPAARDRCPADFRLALRESSPDFA